MPTKGRADLVDLAAREAGALGVRLGVSDELGELAGRVPVRAGHNEPIQLEMPLFAELTREAGVRGVSGCSTGGSWVQLPLPGV